MTKTPIYLIGQGSKLKTKWYLALMDMEVNEDYVIGRVSSGIVVWPSHLGKGPRVKVLMQKLAIANHHIGDIDTNPKAWIFESYVQSMNSTAQPYLVMNAPIPEEDFNAYIEKRGETYD